MYFRIRKVPQVVEKKTVPPMVKWLVVAAILIFIFICGFSVNVLMNGLSR